MARLIGPDDSVRVIYLGNGLVKAQRQPVTFYLDRQLTQPADVLSLTGESIAGSSTLIDAYSRIPQVQYPDGVNVLYASVASGPPLELPAQLVPQLNALAAAVGTAQAGLAGLNKVDNTADVDKLPTGSNIQSTVRRLADPIGDVTVLVLGDSTASYTGANWPDYLLAQIQALYPHRSLRRYAWNTVNNSYDAPVTVATGTGATWINVYNGAQGGTVYENTFSTFNTRVTNVQPDLVLIHYGHNYGTNWSPWFTSEAIMYQSWREQSVRYVSMVKAAVPNADVMITSQNPLTAAGSLADISTGRAQVLRAVAADTGCAYGPICEAYVATGNPAALLNSDGIHPSASGSQLAAGALLPQFRLMRHGQMAPRVPSLYLTTGKSLLANGDFASFAAPPTLPNWTPTTTTLSKNATTYETKGYAVRMEADSAGSCTIYQSLPIGLVKGQWVTLSARVFVATGQSSTPGRVALSGDGGGNWTYTSAAITFVRDQWCWVHVTARVPTNATFATASIICGQGDINADILVDRAVCVLGHLPRDLP